MLNLKKTAVAVLAFGSSAAFAGTMGPVCAPGNVTVPCASTAWDFGAQALYLQPSYSGLGYVGSTTAISGTTNNQSYIKANQDWAWGFKLEGSYHFNTGNDLNLNWYYLDHSRNGNFATSTSATSAVSIGGITLPNNSTQTVLPSDDVKWDAVNIEFGQHAHFGEFKNIRFHGGAQYGYVKNNFNGSITNVVTATGVASTLTHGEDLSFSGFGPRIGADYWYNWGNGFSMYAKGATALLVGSQKFTESVVVPAGLAVASGLATGTYSATGSTTAIVPELEGKLGAKYTYAMAQGDLSLDLGWMWVNYFNVLEAPGIHPATATGSSSRVGGAETNFAVQGPFIGLKWIGNVA